MVPGTADYAIISVGSATMTDRVAQFMPSCPVTLSGNQVDLSPERCLSLGPLGHASGLVQKGNFSNFTSSDEKVWKSVNQISN